MLVYSYHPDSGEFIGTTEADESPNDPGEFLIPANAVTTAPPADVSPGHVAAWNGDAWGEVQDHRGETWWTAEGEALIIQQIGDPLDHDLVAEAPPPPPEPEVVRIRFAMVHQGIVLQTLEADCPMQWQLFDGCVMVFDGEAAAQPGYSYDGTSFQPPPSTEPVDDAA